jgi:hypothetical protein
LVVDNVDAQLVTEIRNISPQRIQIKLIIPDSSSLWHFNFERERTFPWHSTIHSAFDGLSLREKCHRSQAVPTLHFEK